MRGHSQPTKFALATPLLPITRLLFGEFFSECQNRSNRVFAQHKGNHGRGLLGLAQARNGAGLAQTPMVGKDSVFGDDDNTIANLVMRRFV